MFRQNLHAHSTYDDGKSTVRQMIDASTPLKKRSIS